MGDGHEVKSQQSDVVHISLGPALQPRSVSMVAASWRAAAIDVE